MLAPENVKNRPLFGEKSLKIGAFSTKMTLKNGYGFPWLSGTPHSKQSDYLPWSKCDNGKLNFDNFLKKLEKLDLSSAFDTYMVESVNALYVGYRFV